MAVQTAEFVIESLVTMVRIDEIAVLTDSEIVIGWIRREPMPKDGTFIRKRFLEIREIVMRLKGKGVKVRFGHTPGQTNPADICTRPDLEVDLEKAGWWHGPQFCLDPFDSMNLAEIAEGLHEYPEAMIMAIRMEDDQNELIDLSRFSTMSKAIRVMVLVWKFVRHIIHRMPKSMKETRLRRHPNLTLKSESFISCAEQREARTQLYLAHQSEPVTRRYIESKMKENHVG
ncbi:hypothetical protein WR25_15267 [Diploscapter pachys]|uniref:Uncharacterized protein n=1 Tax=Diploscapter pachys TaxID=2018661 RepID=A0A2A2KY64_9BILA|nr:hypothetical protein WR25_15267 [Diploscapter pachys]